MSEDEVKRRRYESAARAAAARERRRRMVAAATQLFTGDGYAATTMSAVAAAAGVGERTVYLAFPTKAALLNECIRGAIRGDDEDAPLLARAGWRAALEAPPERMLALLADASVDLMSRAARLLAIGESVARDDPGVAEFRDRGHAATRADALAMARALKRAKVLRRGLSAARAADVIYGLAASEDVYLRVVGELGWTDAAYARMLEQALAGALAA
jgi:AcrR family transcriptional regulator